MFLFHNNISLNDDSEIVQLVMLINTVRRL